MNQRKEIIEKYNNIIIDIYKEHGLRCLKGLNRECKINDKNIYPFYHEATDSFSKKNNKFNFSKNLEDLLFISDEIMYYTANIILYEPFINDPIKDRMIINEETTLYPNYQNVFAKRFDMFTDICFEKIYAYWDRIGDLISACIKTDINEKNIYFSKVIDSISSEYKNNKNFKWLKSYRCNEFKEMNKKRIDIVHYSSTGTDFQFEHISSATNRERMEELMRERRDLPKFFKKAIEDTLEGFENTLNFLIYVQSRKNL